MKFDSSNPRRRMKLFVLFTISTIVISSIVVSAVYFFADRDVCVEQTFSGDGAYPPFFVIRDDDTRAGSFKFEHEEGTNLIEFDTKNLKVLRFNIEDILEIAGDDLFYNEPTKDEIVMYVATYLNPLHVKYETDCDVDLFEISGFVQPSKIVVDGKSYTPFAYTDKDDYITLDFNEGDHDVYIHFDNAMLSSDNHELLIMEYSGDYASVSIDESKVRDETLWGFVKETVAYQLSIDDIDVDEEFELTFSLNYRGEPVENSRMFLFTDVYVYLDYAGTEERVCIYDGESGVFHISFTPEQDSDSAEITVYANPSFTDKVGAWWSNSFRVDVNNFD